MSRYKGSMTEAQGLGHIFVICLSGALIYTGGIGALVGISLFVGWVLYLDKE